MKIPRENVQKTVEMLDVGESICIHKSQICVTRDLGIWVSRTAIEEKFSLCMKKAPSERGGIVTRIDESRFSIKIFKESQYRMVSAILYSQNVFCEFEGYCEEEAIYG